MELDLTKAERPAPNQAPRVARLTRHLKARLEDFGPGGPEVVQADQKQGVVRFRIPGRDSLQVQKQLEERFQIRTAVEQGLVVCRLTGEVAFEQLDRLWGCLFELVG